MSRPWAITCVLQNARAAADYYATTRVASVCDANLDIVTKAFFIEAGSDAAFNVLIFQPAASENAKLAAAKAIAKAIADAE